MNSAQSKPKGKLCTLHSVFCFLLFSSTNFVFCLSLHLGDVTIIENCIETLQYITISPMSAAVNVNQPLDSESECESADEHQYNNIAVIHNVGEYSINACS